MTKFYPEILNKDQLEIIGKLSFLSTQGFYLAGGTALALQLGHRTSVDFDFYSPDHFDIEKTIENINNNLGKKAFITGTQKDTIFATISNVDVSFFWYQYKLIENLKSFKSVNLASIEDVAAMKMVAITRRPVKRDYIDAYYLIKLLGLEKILHLTSIKYPIISPNIVLRALVYFDDLETETKRPITVLDPDFSWDEAKNFILKEVKTYQFSMFKK